MFNYQWGTATVAGVTAIVLYATSEAGHPVDWPNWTGWDDPLFTHALDVVGKTQQRANKALRGYPRLFHLQMAYQLLWSAIERYTTFRYGIPKLGQIEGSVEQLANEAAFAELVHEFVPRTNETVVDVRLPGGDAIRLDPDRPDLCFKYFRQVRNNVTHRGKTVPDRDLRLLDDSLSQLLPIFRGVLQSAQNDARMEEARWLA